MKSFILKCLKKDRRRFKRYIVSEATPYFLDHPTPREAIIRDLSLGGISITYAKGETSFDKTFDMDIKAVNGFQLGKVTVETVADKPERDKNYAKGEFRRVRGFFVDMSNVQQLKLKVFLKNFEEKISRET